MFGESSQTVSSAITSLKILNEHLTAPRSSLSKLMRELENRLS